MMKNPYNIITVRFGLTYSPTSSPCVLSNLLHPNSAPIPPSRSDQPAKTRPPAEAEDCRAHHCHEINECKTRPKSTGKTLDIRKNDHSLTIFLAYLRAATADPSINCLEHYLTIKAVRWLRTNVYAHLRLGCLTILRFLGVMIDTQGGSKW